MKTVRRVALNGNEEIIYFDDTHGLIQRFENGERVFTEKELNTYVDVQKEHVIYRTTFKTHIGLWYKHLPSPPNVSVS